MLKIREAIVVEGRYDKNTLAQIVDAPILDVYKRQVLWKASSLWLTKWVTPFIPIFPISIRIPLTRTM